MSWFKKETPKEQMRQNERVLRGTNRDIDKERRELERQEQRLELDIKKTAKTGNKEALTVLAKQLVNLRKQKTRTYGMNAKVSAVSSQQRAMHSNVKMADAMGQTAQVMTKMNKQMDPVKLAKTMQDFEKESTKMAMGEEMISDTLDDIMGESGDEEESDAIVNQVLDEIGIQINAKLREAPAPSLGDPTAASASSKAKMTDADIEKMLASLR